MAIQSKTKLQTLLDGWRTNLGYLVAFLVVVPSVLDSINDVWISWNDLPIGQKEKINNKLFKAHWRESPVHSKQLVVEGQGQRIPITIDIYGNGDILVDYGKFTQWFPYKNLEISSNDWLIATAQAEVFDKVKKQVKDIQTNVTVINTEIEKSNVVRDKIYQDGSVERQVIDMNTGEIKSMESIASPTGKGNVVEPKMQSTIIEIIKLPTEQKKTVIDVKDKRIVKHDEDNRTGKKSTSDTLVNE